MSWKTLAYSATSAPSALAAIAAARSLARLEALSGALWSDYAAGRVDDAQTQALAEAIEARRREVRQLDTVATRVRAVAAAAAHAQGRPSYFPPKRKVSSSPDRRASLERRRLLATSGVMPPALAAQFTTGELAALRIVADAVRDAGDCRMTLGEIAARAGVGITTARRGLREAAAQGLILIEERRRHRRPNLPNVVRIISAEWGTWIARGARPAKGAAAASSSEGGGRQKAGATDRASYRSLGGGRALRVQQLPFSPRRSPLATASG
jgi:hypothetical protein